MRNPLARSPRPIRRWDLTALVLAVSAWLFNPYCYAVSDHTYKIPFLRAATDRTLYARDLTVQMRAAYVSFFSWMVAPLESLVGLEMAFFVIHSVTLIAFFWLTARLGAVLTGERTTGWFALLLLFFPQEVAGGIATFDVAVEERFIAFALVLASLVLLTRGREVAAGLIAGLAGDIHLVTLANFLVAVACLFGVEFARSEPRRARVFSAGRFLGAMFVALLPVLALKLRSDSIGCCVAGKEAITFRQ